MSENYRSQIQAGLHYWQRKTEDFSHQDMAWLDERYANLRQIVEEGLKYDELWQETAVVIVQVFHFMEWRGYWQSWIPTLAAAIAQCRNTDTNICNRLNSQLAQFYRLDGRFAEAEKLHQIVLRQAKQHQNYGQLAAIYREMSQCQLAQNHLQKAERFALLALKHSEQVPEKKRLTAFILQTLGIIKRVRGDCEAALAYFEPALSIRRELEEHVLLADVLNEIALTYEVLQDYDTALQVIAEALIIIEETGNENMHTLFLMNKGVFYYRQNRLPEAVNMFQQLDFFALKRQGNLFHCGLAMQNLGNALFDHGQFFEAEPYIQEAINIFRSIHNEIHLANSSGTLAQILKAKGKTVEAKALFDEAINLLEKHPENAWANTLLAKFVEQRSSL